MIYRKTHIREEQIKYAVNKSVKSARGEALRGRVAALTLQLGCTIARI